MHVPREPGKRQAKVKLQAAELVEPVEEPTELQAPFLDHVRDSAVVALRAGAFGGYGAVPRVSQAMS